jgi:hypothetical protein
VKHQDGTLPRITEKAFMRQVVALAKLRGWKVFHPFDSRKSAPGFPDLILLRGKHILAVELKTDTGKTTLAQEAWLAAFEEAHVFVDVWRPHMWNRIEELLA